MTGRPPPGGPPPRYPPPPSVGRGRGRAVRPPGPPQGPPGGPPRRPPGPPGGPPQRPPGPPTAGMAAMRVGPPQAQQQADVSMLSSRTPTVSSGSRSSMALPSSVGTGDISTPSRRLLDVATSAGGSAPPSVAPSSIPPASAAASGSFGGPSQQRTVSPPGSPPGERRAPPSQKKVVQLYRGNEGKPLPVSSNYLKLDVAKGKGVYEYEVSYEPRIDNRNTRFRLMNQHRGVYGNEKSFDGVKLFLPHRLPQDLTVLPSNDEETGETVKVIIKFLNEKTTGDRAVVQFFNILFNRIFRMLKFSQHNRNFYDPKGAHSIKQYNLQVWPGYVTAVDFYEGGLLLQIDVSHRVLRTETARDMLISLAKQGKDVKAEAERALLGASVLTRYNNKSYKIDDIDFDASPKSTFEDSNGAQVSYLEYYKRQYSIDIKDHDQPLLINRPKKKAMNEQEVQKIICLIPELCMLTGMTDAMRSDFRIMKEVSNFTRITPDQRKNEMSGFLKRVAACEPATALLDSWGLHMSPDPIQLDARLLAPEILFFGKNYREQVNPKGDWGRTATGKPVLTPVNLNKWAILFPEKNKVVAQNFCKIMAQQAPRMGIQIAQPKPVSLANDRSETYLKQLRDLIDPSVQLVMTIVPQVKSDRYAAIKKLCCIEKPVASQVIVLKTINNEKKVSSVAQKVILQINCKLGGELWACQSPYKKIMVVGIDVFHEKARRSGSIAGVVTTLNDNMSRFYSNVAIQREGQEIIDALKVAFMDSLIKYYDVNHYWPSSVLVFRDGVGDGMMETTADHEVKQFTRAFAAFKEGPPPGASKEVQERYKKLAAQQLPADYDPDFAFVVVQKRINTRLFGVRRSGPQSVAFENPPAGTVLDHTVTRFNFKDFFLVPQSVTMGTVSPTHYVVLSEAGKKPFTPDQVQRLAYKMSHMYFNWPGTVRVPSVCQYAHKLVDLVGENLRQVPSPELSTKLYFL